MKQFMFGLYALLLGFFARPVFGADEGLVICGGHNQPECTYADIIPTIQNILNKGLVFIIIPILTTLIIVGGFKMLTAGGNESKYKSGLDMIKGVIWGFGFALLAWVVVRTILLFLGLTTN